MFRVNQKQESRDSMTLRSYLKALKLICILNVGSLKFKPNLTWNSYALYPYQFFHYWLDSALLFEGVFAFLPMCPTKLLGHAVVILGLSEKKAKQAIVYIL